MPASKQVRTLSVRLPDSEIRHFKSIAAGRGVSLQSAVQSAIRGWIASSASRKIPSLDELQGSLASVDVMAFLKAERDAELARDRRR